ncbi:MAG: outer membrane lipoprotein chaperone LolA, partial [Pseudomonadota bacterium]
AAAAAANPPLPADKVVDEVQRYYREIQKLKAGFKQTYTNTVFGKSSESHGKLYLTKPGKMRWDYERPSPKYFVSDGTTLWVYEPENAQAFKQDLTKQVLPVAVAFLQGEGDLARDFQASLDPGRYGGKNDYVLKLVPRTPSAQYKQLWLVVDPADFHVKESVILESSDNINHFRFFDIKLNDKAKFANRHFRFKPPAGVKVITPKEQ